MRFQHAKLVAFGATHLARFDVEDDLSVKALLHAHTPAVAIFGKSWDLHVHRALEISEQENLRIISETVRYLKNHGKEVIYDAEHFFDGFAANSEFALRTIEAAKQAGADVIVLCDTNGGTMTGKLAEVCSKVRERIEGTLGIHTHNDADLAVANTLTAVDCGFTHVQGCMNGYGERCGNANLVSVIANLEMKMGHTSIGSEKLTSLSSVAKFIAERANYPLRGDQPYVGKSAFAHKAGVHVSAVLKDPRTYEHVVPESIGNRQRVLLSDLSGRASVLYKLQEQQFEILDDAARRELLERIKEMEYLGYEFEAADGTFELLVRRMHDPVPPFENSTYRVISEPSGSTAIVTIKVIGKLHSATADGNRPVDALNFALRQCLSDLHPEITETRLMDHKIHVLDLKSGSTGRVRVRLEWSDDVSSWATMGVAENVIDANWLAIQDAVQLDLMRLPQTFNQAPKSMARTSIRRRTSVRTVAQH